MILNDLKKRASTVFGLYLTGSKEEKKYIRIECTYRRVLAYGGEYAIIKDKKTGEKIELPIYREE